MPRSSETSQKRFKDYRRTTIWPLLTELMALDTQKHIHILEFLLHHAKRRPALIGEAPGWPLPRSMTSGVRGRTAWTP